MKKQNLVNLIRYHLENNDSSFRSEVAEIARDFDKHGDITTSQYLMELISDANYYIPQSSYQKFNYLTKMDYSTKPLFLPSCIEEDILGIVRSIKLHRGLSKFLFYGAPGSGKTESAYQIARLLERDILTVNFEQLIDSRLGETAKNVAVLFREINQIHSNRVIIILDEIDALIMDRVNANDLREMGRVTSVFLREFDRLNEETVIIATTNLYNNLDKALIRRFDSSISFDRYSQDDLIEVADLLLSSSLKKSPNSKQNIRLFHKILQNLDAIPYPGELKQIIKTAIAFSDESIDYDYLRRIFFSLNNISESPDVVELRKQKYTTREIEILSRIPKSSVARKLRGNK